ncbi:exported hypothetical protein [Burkholderiales bacterium]|nr:exported hypothetical protein [Burkholderiales bacterium]
MAAAVTVASSAPAAPLAPIRTLPAERGAAAPNSWSVQLGAFAVTANAEALRDRLALLLSAPEADGLPAAARTPWVEYDGKFSRVLIGSLGDRATAQAWALQLERFLVRETALYAR